MRVLREELLSLGRTKIYGKRRVTDSGCWEFTGATTVNGYGRVILEKKPILVHRLSWILGNGRSPKPGKLICHHCDNRKCFNPAHLYEGTHKDNHRDMVKRKRHWHQSRPGYFCGEKSPRAKINELGVKKIFDLRAAGYTHQKIADEMLLSDATICLILSGKRWGHLGLVENKSKKARKP